MRGATGGTYKEVDGKIVKVAGFEMFPDNKVNRAEHEPFDDPYPKRDINIAAQANTSDNVMPPVKGVIPEDFEENEDNQIDKFEAAGGRLSEEQLAAQRKERNEERKRRRKAAVEAAAKAEADKIKTDAGVTDKMPENPPVNKNAVKTSQTPPPA